MYLEIASAAAALVNYAILVDTRKAHAEVSKTDLFFLASELSKRPDFRSRKTAVLCPRERFDFVGFFAVPRRTGGCKSAAFTSFEDAIEWLTADEAGSDGQ